VPCTVAENHHTGRARVYTVCVCRSRVYRTPNGSIPRYKSNTRCSKSDVHAYYNIWYTHRIGCILSFCIVVCVSVTRGSSRGLRGWFRTAEPAYTHCALQQRVWSEQQKPQRWLVKMNRKKKKCNNNITIRFGAKKIATDRERRAYFTHIIIAVGVGIRGVN